MSRYEQLIPSYAVQKSQGLKPRGRCSTCGRDLALRMDNTVSGHCRENRQGRPSAMVCTEGPTRSGNLASDRAQLDLNVVEVRLLSAAIVTTLGQSMTMDRDKAEILRGVLEQLTDPARRICLTYEQEEQMLSAVATKQPEEAGKAES